MRRVTTILLTLLTSPAIAGDCTVPGGWQAMTPVGQTAISAGIQIEPAPVSHPFIASFWLCPSADVVSVSAMMPAHQHGMKYRPDITVNGNRIEAKGMVFHMPGLWRIELSVGADAAKGFSFDHLQK